MTAPGGTGESLPQLADLTALAAPLEPDAAERRRLIELAVAHVEDHLEAAPALPTLVPRNDVARELLAFGVPEEPREPSEVLDVLRRLVDMPGVATTSPRYLGYIPSGGLFSAAVADFLAAATNRYAGQAAISPGAAGVEHVVVRWLADAVGFGPAAGGVLTSGGSTGALVAVVAARDAAGVGLTRSPRPAVYLGEHTHHSMDLALRICGLAGAAVRRLPVDQRYRVDVRALERAVREDRRSGLLPFLVVATAGTTNTGAVDPLAQIADVAAREGLWFHVDGAYGGLFTLCPEGREVLDGIDRADSVVVDPHKTLFLPYGIGAALVRNGDVLETAFSPSADYLAPAPASEPPSPADLGPELTRHFRGLRLWLPLQLAGRAAFAAALSEKILLARHVHSRLAGVPGIDPGPPPDLSIVSFRVPGTSPDDDSATARVASDLQRQGEVFLTTTRIGGRLVLRMAVGSFRTHLTDVDQAVDAVLRAADLSGSRSRRQHAIDVTVVAGRTSTPPPLVRRRAIQGRPRLELLAGRPDQDVLACEADVLFERYGNTADDLRQAYGAYEDATVFLAVRDASGQVLGWARLITPGPLPLKTVADLSSDPWRIDALVAADEIGIDLGQTWDVTTIGVRRELGSAGARIAAALYHGVITATRVNGAVWVLAMLDVRVRMLLDRVGLVMSSFPGATPQSYLGSPATAPVYAHMEHMVREQRISHPEQYRTITLGRGLHGIWLPPPDDFLLPSTVTVDLRETDTQTA